MKYTDIISTISTKQPGTGATATNSLIYTISGPTGPTGPQGPTGSTGSGSGGTGSSVIISDTIPSTTADSQLWFNSSDGSMYICYSGVYIQI